jgi:XTP/dITP diphosphohydrolase
MGYPKLNDICILNSLYFIVDMSTDPGKAAESSVLEGLQQLIEVVAKLRSPDGGCPWDLAQTPKTLIPYIIEEAYEVVDAIRSGDKNAIAEELGDLLLQVVLQAQIATEVGDFTLKEVAQGISQKLIRRHPHVFGAVEVRDMEEIRQNWEEIKAAEKGETTADSQLLSRKLQSYTRKSPPIIAGMRISEKAAEAGFEWEDINGVWAKFHEELAEFQEAIEAKDKIQQEAELGDLLFTLINLARWYNLNPAEALSGTNQRVINRLAQMEAIANRPLSEYTLEELDRLWEQAKALLKMANG